MSFTQHQKDITHLEFTSSLNYLVSASMDRTIRVWNLDNASLVRLIFFPEVIVTFKLTTNSDLLIAGGEEGNLYVWNLKSCVKIHTILFAEQRPKRIMAINFSIDEKFVVVNSKQKLAYYLTSKIMESKSKSAYENFYNKGVSYSY